MNTYVRDNTADLDARVDAIPTVEGIGPNSVTATVNDTFTTTSTTYQAVTNLEVTITPSSNTSKVLIFASVCVSSSETTARAGVVSVFRDGNNLLTGEGDRIAGFTLVNHGNVRNQASHPLVFLDSPATDSSVTYQVYLRINESGATALINRGSSDGDDGRNMRGTSTLTAIEVKP
jgi:hypothetical protein